MCHAVSRARYSDGDYVDLDDKYIERMDFSRELTPPLAWRCEKNTKFANQFAYLGMIRTTAHIHVQWEA